MTRTRALFLSALVAFSASNASAQAPVPIELTLRASASAVPLHRDFALHALVKNSGNARTVALRGAPGFGPGGGLELVVTDAAGKRRIVPHPTRAPSLEEATRNGRAVLLRRGEALAVRHREAARKIFLAPGRYRLSVRYSPVTHGAALPIAGADESQSAESPHISVEVIP